MTTAYIVPKRGRDVAGLGRYLHGPGRHNEHTNQRVIAAAETLAIADGTRMRYPEEREQVQALGADLDSHRKALGIEVRGGHVWHCAISNPSTDRELSDEEWAQVARMAVERLGFTAASGKAPCRWDAVHHGRSLNGNDHIHLVVNLVREDGSIASIWNDRRTMSQVCRAVEKRFGLGRVEGRTGAGMPGLSRAEIERVARTPGTPEPDRRRLARMVRGCATAAADEADFVGRLQGSGVRVRPRYAKGGTSEVVGYSVALSGTRGRPVWFGGGRLAPDLTLPRLREHWPDWDTEVERQAALAAWDRQATAGSGARSRRAATYGPQVWQQAAEAVARAREQLAATPAEDVETWAGAAREAAGVLAAWSARVEADRPGPLAAAADALARAAQTTRDQPHARRHGAVMDLRGVAMVAFVASGQGSAASQAVVLRQVIHMIEALQTAHEARGQAQRAMALAEVAHGQLTQLQSTLTARVAAGPVGSERSSTDSIESIPPAARPPGPARDGTDFGRT